LARLNVARGDFAAAEAVLKQAVAGAPKSSEAELALGQLYMIASEPAKAEAELRRAIELDPKNGSAMLGLAAIQIAGKRMEEAEQTYRQLSSLPRPDYKPLHALFLLAAGKRDAALAELEKLAKEAPGDRGAGNRLFAAYRAMGKNQAAQSLVTEALKKNSKDVDALFHRAGLSAETGNLASAEQDLKEVLHFTSDSAEAHFALARIYKARGLAMNMRQELHEALRIDPALLQARVALARTLTLANEPKSALDVVDAAPAGQKETLILAVERNWALLSLGETKELKAALDRELGVRHLPELLIQDAILRCQLGEFSAARLDAEEVIHNNPQDVRAVRLLTESYVLQKQPAKAEERLKAIVAASPHSAPLADFLGEWYLGSNNTAAARTAFESALAANPKFLSSALALADLDYREKHPEAARRQLLRALAVDPKNVRALVMLGTIAGEAGDRQEAIDRYRAVLAIDDSNLPALNNLAYALALSSPDDALKYAQHAAELAPDNPTVEDTLGWVFYRKAIYGSAVRYLEAAVAKDPTPRRQFHLAMSYLKFGDRDKGEKTLKTALQKAPDLTKSEEGW
jgi:tetratricopeptide (TPR) repeat protein